MRAMQEMSGWVIGPVKEFLVFKYVLISFTSIRDEDVKAISVSIFLVALIRTKNILASNDHNRTNTCAL